MFILLMILVSYRLIYLLCFEQNNVVKYNFEYKLNYERNIIFVFFQNNLNIILYINIINNFIKTELKLWNNVFITKLIIWLILS